MHELNEGDWTDYKTAAAARKLLSKIQKECDVARKVILDTCKQANPKLFKVDVTKE